jgi:hypothetical protein
MTVLNIEGVGRVTVGPEFDQLPPAQQQATVDEIAATARPPSVGVGGTIDDVIQSAGSGIAKGYGMLLGLPGDLQRLAGRAKPYLPEVTPDPNSVRNAERFAGRGDLGPSFPLPTSEQVNSVIQSVTGPFYKSQTTPGKYAGTIGEFIPTAGRRVLTMAGIPGLTSETAGQVTQGTPYEPYARAGAAVAGGFAGAMLSRPATAEQVLRNQLPNLDPVAVNQAEQLIQAAAARGITLTWPEALERVAPGTGLVNAQRLAESMPGGREILSPALAQRPAQIEAAARNEFGAFGPLPQRPSSIGPSPTQAAEAEAERVRRSINAVAEPYYTQAAVQPLSRLEAARLRSLPGYDEARAAIRNDPQLNRYVAGLGDDTVGFANEVKKYLGAAAENASSPVTTQGRNMQRSAGYGSDERIAREAAVNSSRPYGGQYETALAIEEGGRRLFLEPLLAGPIGKLASSDKTTKQAIEALFPSNPVAGTAREVTEAVGALNRSNPAVARQLIRAHAETTFNEAAQALQGGANQFGGAKFAAIIAGNPQQRENLRAAVVAANGQQAWNGFERFLNVLEATGTRQTIGSRTAFNAQELKDLTTGTFTAAAVKSAGSPTRLMGIVSDTWGRWQLGRNLDQLARIMVDPNAVQLFRRIAASPSNSQAALTLTARLAAMANSQMDK